MTPTAHAHWSEDEGRFVTHTHIHSRPHQHDIVPMGGRLVQVSVPGPGNYSPHPQPEED